MSRYCLDTSAYSHFRRGHRRVVELLSSAEWIGMPAVTLGELRTGFILGRAKEKNEGELIEFLAHPSVYVLDVDEAVSAHYARLVSELRLAGTPLPTNDIWIAATAARHGGTVITYDNHYARITGVAALVLAIDS